MLAWDSDNEPVLKLKDDVRISNELLDSNDYEPLTFNKLKNYFIAYDNEGAELYE